MERNREQEGLPSNRRNWNEVENESRFKNSDNKRGEQVLGQVSSSVSTRNDFHFYPQVATSSGGGTASGIHPTNLNEVVQDVKINPQN